jgi:hypothetical protein
MPSGTPNCAAPPCTRCSPGARSFANALSSYQRTRDAQVLPIYEFTAQMATLEAPPEEMRQLLGAVSANHDAMDDFASVLAGTLSPVEFFDPQNIGAIFGTARHAS